MATIGSLIINLLANTAGFTQQMEGARKTTTKFGRDVESAIGGSSTEGVMRAVRVMGHLRAATAAASVSFDLLKGDIETAAETVKKLPFGVGEFARSLEDVLGKWTGIASAIERAKAETALVDARNKDNAAAISNANDYVKELTDNTRRLNGETISGTEAADAALKARIDKENELYNAIQTRAAADKKAAEDAAKSVLVFRERESTNIFTGEKFTQFSGQWEKDAEEMAAIQRKFEIDEKSAHAAHLSRIAQMNEAAAKNRGAIDTTEAKKSLDDISQMYQDYYKSLIQYEKDVEAAQEARWKKEIGFLGRMKDSISEVFGYIEEIGRDDPFNFDPEAKMRGALDALKAMEEIQNNLNDIEAQKPRGERDIEARNRASGGEFRQFERGRFKFTAGTSSGKTPVATGLEGLIVNLTNAVKEITTGATAQ